MGMHLHVIAKNVDNFFVQNNKLMYASSYD